jgi:hypothetical protein
MITRLFRITQASHGALDYIIEGLRNRYASADYKFDSEFDAKTGDYYVVVNTNFTIPEAWISILKNEKVEK